MNLHCTECLLDEDKGKRQQYITEPGKYGYMLRGVVSVCAMFPLEKEREQLIEECIKPNMRKRARTHLNEIKDPPWSEIHEATEEVDVCFSWTEEIKPLIYDKDNNKLDNPPQILGGSRVWIVFHQKAYILPDGRTGGTALKLHAIKIEQLYQEPTKPSEDQILELLKNTGEFHSPEFLGHSRYSKWRKDELELSTN